MEKLQGEIKIETSNILNDFKKHLEIDNNKRILFSGPFGTGKSTFLNELSQNENDDYFYLKIFPVNYSVSANEDVFELIKFDILFQLIGNYYNQIDLEKEDFTLLLKSQVFIMEHLKFMPLLYAILGFSEKIGTPIVDFIKALEQTVGNFKKFSKDIKIDEEGDIKAFLKSIEEKKGNTYEMDAVSGLIFDLIQRVKKQNDKQSVLIIDDLDRLDPEHIFRLFNIFSAHYNQINGNNKFGFDKIIFVCDIENIRKIFHHRYGFDVDFSGYIDKFYSITPFDFDNRKYVKNKIRELLQKVKLDTQLDFYNFHTNQRFFIVVRAVVQTLIDAKLLNLRMLLSCPDLMIPDYYYGKKTGNAQSVLNSPLIVLFYLLKIFYGSFDILEMKIKFLYESFDRETFKSDHNYQYIISSESDVENLVSYCLPFLLPEDVAYEKDVQDKTYYLENYGCTIHYNGFNNNYVGFKNFQKATRGDNVNSEEIELNPYLILFDTFTRCKKRGILK
ncbi:hypothetical protein RT99_02130 [Flavobacterium sp. MEB061]|uniref:P-loop NTPase fold protein n=1 Tax=Flavobacterium sp. MEB061 TaxID=1587524 RepID=UPI0005ABFA7B|nr:P-loop NTPase fold protein [Flavobacterium sp. MEB061]KIQ24901.1 hypothetical protein RT99_02130 [Flavobacterium sp. MEB061]